MSAPATLTLAPRGEKRLAFTDDEGTEVAVLLDRGSYGTFAVQDPGGETLLEGRKRRAFVYSRWWDVTAPAGDRLLSMQLGNFRTKKGIAVLPDGRRYEVRGGQRALDAVLALEGGETALELTETREDTMRVVRTGDDLGLLEMLGAAGLWRLSRRYHAAQARAGAATQN